MRGNWVNSGLAAPVGTVGGTRAKAPTVSRAGTAKPVNASQFGTSLRTAMARISPRRQNTVTLAVPRPALRKEASATPKYAAYDSLIRSTAKREGVDEELVKAVVEAESGFNAKAVSPAGAKGLMQLMDGTARSLGVKDSLDPADNVAGGVKFLRSMLDRFGSVPLALAAYNAGPGAVEKYGGVPPYRETKSYVDRVLRLQQRYEAAAAGDSANGGADVGRLTV